MESPGSLDYAGSCCASPAARERGRAASPWRSLVRLNARSRPRPGHGEAFSCNRHAAGRTLCPGVADATHNPWGTR